ncbi:MAG: hypothetical protein IPK50_23580 [Fibrobacterota bacterium]|nr:MAG: hypothetical protein IPK50_23580 [Fibrobacterota bacterium]
MNIITPAIILLSLADPEMPRKVYEKSFIWEGGKGLLRANRMYSVVMGHGSKSWKKESGWELKSWWNWKTDGIPFVEFRFEDSVEIEGVAIKLHDRSSLESYLATSSMPVFSGEEAYYSDKVMVKAGENVPFSFRIRSPRIASGSGLPCGYDTFVLSRESVLPLHVKVKSIKFKIDPIVRDVEDLRLIYSRGKADPRIRKGIHGLSGMAAFLKWTKGANLEALTPRVQKITSCDWGESSCEDTGRIVQFSQMPSLDSSSERSKRFFQGILGDSIVYDIIKDGYGSWKYVLQPIMWQTQLIDDEGVRKYVRLNDSERAEMNRRMAIDGGYLSFGPKYPGSIPVIEIDRDGMRAEKIGFQDINHRDDFDIARISEASAERVVTSLPTVKGGVKLQDEFSWIKVGSKYWLADNIRSHPIDPLGWCPGSNYSEKGRWNFGCSIWGVKYPYSVAKTICPEGSHLPTRLEWKELVDELQKPSSQKFESHNAWMKLFEKRGCSDEQESAISGGFRIHRFGLFFSSDPIGYSVEEGGGRFSIRSCIVSFENNCWPNFYEFPDTISAPVIGDGNEYAFVRCVKN